MAKRGSKPLQPVTIEDYDKIVEPSEAKFSPDGAKIAYVLKGDPYVVKASGGQQPVKLSKAGNGYANVRPLWSLDGKTLFLSFYSSERETHELWSASADNSRKYKLLAQMSAEAWEPNLSPDHSRWLMAASEAPKRSSNKTKAPDGAPIVIDAMIFKRDSHGYLAVDATDSIYSWDIPSQSAIRLTDDAGHDTQATWSPDGDRIAFIREDLSRAEYCSDLCVAFSDGRENRTSDKLTSSSADRRSPGWSPDGKQIAYLWRDSEKGPYAVAHLAILSLETGNEVVVTRKHDRTITSFQFSPDGRFIYFLYDNEGGSHLARLRLSDNHIEKLVTGERFIASFDLNRDGHVVLNMKTMNDAIDVYVLKEGSLVRLTDVNHDYFEKKTLASKDQFYYSPRSRLRVQALVTKPAGFDPSKKYPTILRIHGGPVQQAKFGYDFLPQLLAANGYVVVEPNPPGSTGRGQTFISSVRADWGFRKKPDVLGAIDEAVKLGFVDRSNLAVIGYSYGGYMTNCLITAAPETFKAAVSGAGHSFIAANYGHDIYLKWYNWGLGPPWLSESRKRYEKLSPLNHADKVRTPTLFLCGAQDWNVPILNAELFYQALRVRGVPTRLVVYPKAAHTANWDDGECENSKDYYERVLSWLDQFLKRP